jgi:hypothetical protein
VGPLLLCLCGLEIFEVGFEQIDLALELEGRGVLGLEGDDRPQGRERGGGGSEGELATGETEEGLCGWRGGLESRGKLTIVQCETEALDAHVRGCSIGEERRLGGVHFFHAKFYLLLLL